MKKPEKARKMRIKVKLIECEVYSRVIGYYRPISNWNVGKQEEFRVRKPHRWSKSDERKD